MAQSWTIQALECAQLEHDCTRCSLRYYGISNCETRKAVEVLKASGEPQPDKAWWEIASFAHHGKNIDSHRLGIAAKLGGSYQEASRLATGRIYSSCYF